MRSILDAELTHDAFLGGRIRLWQPRKGYRAGVDPVLLAASVQAKAGQTVLDLGCGVGAAALCLGARVPGLSLLGVERQADYAALATRNGLDTVVADLTDLPHSVKACSFDHVLANPPYFDREHGHMSPDTGREGALGIDTPLADWIGVAARRLKPKGFLHVIHRAERIPELLSVTATRLGSLALWPISPRHGKTAELVILQARKEGRSPFQLHAPIIMHTGATHQRDGDDYTPLITGVLRHGFPLIP